MPGTAEPGVTAEASSAGAPDPRHGQVRRRCGGHNGGVSNASQSPLSPLPAPDRPEVAARLRDALLGASFTADGLLELLGAPAYAALARSETVPALRATRGDTPLEMLVRLFLLQQPVPHARVADVLPVDACLATGWLEHAGADELAATVDVRPYGGPGGEDWFIVSDLGCAVGGAGGIGSRDEESSWASAAPPRPSPASPSVRPSAPPSTSAPVPASRRCTRPGTPHA